MSRPEETTSPERSSWWPDPRTSVAQLISVAIHAILLIAIAVALMYEERRAQVNPAELDVIEYQETAIGPPVETVDDSEIEVEATELEEQTTEEIEEVQETEAPDVTIMQPEIDRSEPAPEGWDPADWQQQQDDLARAIDQLRQNVAASDPQPRAGQGGRDPHSRGEQQKRWTIYYEWSSGCQGFGRMLNQIGIREVGTILGSEIIYIDSTSRATRRGDVDREDRMLWIGEIRECERQMLTRLQYQHTKIIWFMERAQEPVLKQLEVDYAQSRGIDIENVAATVFTPYQSGGSWKLQVKSMR